MRHFSIRKRINSFKHAFNGLQILLIEEHNSRIHLVATILVIFLGFYFDIEIGEWMAIAFAIGLVLICEIFNTAIENISDFISPERNEAIKRIKDLSAAAVLISSILAVIIGTLIFLSKC